MKALIVFLKNPLLYIFITALVLRTVYLTEIPGGFHVDEVKAGWNAYSILKTGRDDWGNLYPLYYDSFGDFRPTGIIFSIIPSIVIFGLNEFAVRFPSAFFGSLTVIPLFYFIKILLVQNKLIQKDINLIAYSSAGLIALSPWHISLSRATSEGIIAICLALSGLTLFTATTLKSNIIKFNTVFYYFLSFLFFITSYFFYHNTRLLIPAFAVTSFFFLIVNDFKLSKDKLKLFFSKKPAVILLILLCLATIYFASQKEARGRFSQVSIFSNLDIKRDLDKYPFELGPGRVLEARLFFNKPLSYARRFFEEYARYFSSDFFIVYGSAKPVRYEIAGMGIITYVEFALIFIGLIASGKYRLPLLPIALLLIAPLPAALTTEDAPNMHRALFMIPFLSVLMAYGLYYLYRLNMRKFLLPVFFALFIFNFAFFLHMYLIHNPVHEPIPLYRNASAKQLALKIDELDNKFDRVIITNIPDSIYPWLAFYTKVDPAIFNKVALARQKGVWSYKNLEFSAQRCPSRDAFKYQTSKKVLVIDAEGCNGKDVKYPPYIKINGEIKRPDGAVTYTLWEEDKELRKFYPELEPKEASVSADL